MQIKRLGLINFRNHRSTEIEFAPGVTVISGPNGAGKTSLLEAIYLLSTGRSFRASDDNALLMLGSDKARISGQFSRQDRDVSISLTLGGGRLMEVNGVQRKRGKDVFGLLRTVVFSPDDLDLIKGAPGLRRDCIDESMQSFAPRTQQVRSEWERVLRQRNSLLRSLRGRATGASAALDTWTQLVVEKATSMAMERMQAVRLLAPEFTLAAKELALDDVSMRYWPSWLSREGSEYSMLAETPEISQPDLSAALKHALEQRLSDELIRGVTLVGVHRDDVDLTIGERDARTRASQGEQRLLAIALKLAQLRVLERILCEEPVLLLDDVLSELDESRRMALLSRLPKAQTLISATGTAGQDALLVSHVREFGDLSVVAEGGAGPMQFDDSPGSPGLEAGGK